MVSLQTASYQLHPPSLLTLSLCLWPIQTRGLVWVTLQHYPGMLGLGMFFGPTLFSLWAGPIPSSVPGAWLDVVGVQGTCLVKKGVQRPAYRVMGPKGEMSLGLLQPLYTQNILSCSQFQWLFKRQIWSHFQPPLSLRIALKIKSNSFFMSHKALNVLLSA